MRELKINRYDERMDMMEVMIRKVIIGHIEGTHSIRAGVLNG